MGLLSHMEALHAAEKQQNNDSVSCSVFSSTHDILDFHDFAEKTGMKKCGMLIPFGKRYFMRYSHGLDAASICKAISTMGFWEGTFPGNQDWTFFANAALQPYFQLFSEEVVSRLDQIRIKSFVVLADIPVRVILFTLDKNFTEVPESLIQSLSTFIAKDISNISGYVFPPKDGITRDLTRYYEVNIDVAIEEIINSMDYEAQSILEHGIISEIFNIIKSIVPKDDCCKYDDGKITIALNSANSLDSDLLQFHLQKILKTVLGNNSNKITVTLKNEGYIA